MRATARAQPNIALIKYWGKSDVERNLPAVGSISVTLDRLSTSMCVEISKGLHRDELILDGEQRQDLLPRVSLCLDRVLGSERSPVRVISECNFPVGAGLASSASSFAALVTAADAATGASRSRAELARLAGRASGSAARSIYGGYVELENTGENIALEQLCAPDDWPMVVVIAVTETGPKSIGSTEAMENHRKTSPFYSRWVEQQPQDLDVARQAIEGRDFAMLADIAEHNCLKMHSVMWGARPPTIYWNSVTLDCMQAVRRLQADVVPAFFTIDAGPQVKVFCLPDAADDVRRELASVDGVQDLLECGIGNGAMVIDHE